MANDWRAEAFAPTNPITDRRLPITDYRLASGENEAILNAWTSHTAQAPGEQRRCDKQSGSKSNPNSDGSERKRERAHKSGWHRYGPIAEETDQHWKPNIG
jgi:hypothetical protein